MHVNALARIGLLATLPLASFLGACSSSSSKKVAVDDWVSDLCDAAVDFDKASDKAGEAFLSADFEDTKEAKDAFKESVDKQKDAQKEFRDAFGKIGQPDINGGDKVIAAFKKQFDENDKMTNDVAKAVAKIEDDADFVEEFMKIADDFDTPDFREKLDELADDHDDVADLIDSIDADDQCSSVIFDQPGADDTAGNEPTVAPRPSKTATAGKTPATTAAKTANEKWVATVCTSFGGWIEDIDNANKKLDSTLTGAKDAPALKKALVDFMKTGQTETKNLQKEIGALKAPDVKDGAKIQKTFNDATAQLVKVFDGLVADAEKVGTSSLSQTAADVDQLSAGIGAAFSEVGETFDKLDSLDAGELDALFDERPECLAIK